jgi:hypothetical protein
LAWRQNAALLIDHGKINERDFFYSTRFQPPQPKQ